jgi:hypothetical protein
MKKITIVLATVLFTVLVSSCASLKVPLEGSGMKAALVPRDYEMLGEVVYTGTAKSILGLVTWGGASYYELNWIAKEKYSADDVINVSEDVTARVFLLLYMKQDYVMRGIAIKYKK